jgi:hypothetical protein
VVELRFTVLYLPEGCLRLAIRCMDARRNGWNGRSHMAFDVGQVSESFLWRNGKLDQMNVIMLSLTFLSCKCELVDLAGFEKASKEVGKSPSLSKY